MNRNEIEQLMKDHTDTEVARITGIPRTTIKEWRDRFPTNSKHFTDFPLEVKEKPDKALWTHEASRPDDKIFKFDKNRYMGEVIKFGIVSDTHIGSECQQLTHLHTAYKHFSNEGITDVIHAGDLFAGNGKVYKGQIYEMFLMGASKIRKYAHDNYPYQKGIKTHILRGNHDASFFKDSGDCQVQLLSQEREDINYLGSMGAYININGIKIYVQHPDGGVPYARSYRLQKIIEQFAPEGKPDVFILGHLHVQSYLPMYRNVCGIMMPCFESQTEYLRRKGLYPEIGYVIMELIKNNVDRKNGIVMAQPRFYPFYVPIREDY